ncbi:hypothetical protein AnigIFM59636_002484 [Aspergillus niger]|nr:hypothetical protein AnigIFM59636_002484 [Aspergillus niger]
MRQIFSHFISCIEWRAIPYSILPAAYPEAQLAGAIGTLCSYSFLERRDGGMKFDMHRLVHLATRIWVNQNGHEAETRIAVLKHIVKVFPSDDYINREVWRDYLPHVARIEKDKQFQDTEEMSELYLKVGRCLYVDGRIKEAVLWLQESCTWRDRGLAQNHPSRLTSQHELARAYQANGQVKEAVKLLENGRKWSPFSRNESQQHFKAVGSGSYGRDERLKIMIIIEDSVTYPYSDYIRSYHYFARA